jgi:hypothetical protein
VSAAAAAGVRVSRCKHLIYIDSLFPLLQELAVDPELNGQQAFRDFLRVDEYEALARSTVPDVGGGDGQGIRTLKIEAQADHLTTI